MAKAPGGTTREALRAEVIAAAVAEIAHAGPTRYRAAVVARFAKQGLHPATVYRWLAAAAETGQLGQQVSKAFRDRSAAPAKDASGGDDLVAAADQMLTTMPSLTSFEEIAGHGTIDITAALRECITAARDVMRQARDAEGRPRMSKLLMLGSEHLRRCLETGQRIVEKVNEIQRVQEFHKIIMEEIRAERPEVAMRILERMDAVSRQWGAV